MSPDLPLLKGTLDLLILKTLSWGPMHGYGISTWLTDRSDGTLENGRIFGEEPGGKGDGVPDGMKVDKDGNLYVTGPKGIWIWDPQGHHLGTIAMPEQPANLAWGDGDYGTLYITATTSVYRLKTKAHGFVPYLSNSR